MKTNQLLFAVLLGIGALIVIPMMLKQGGPFDVKNKTAQSFWDWVWNLVSNGYGLDSGGQSPSSTSASGYIGPYSLSAYASGNPAGYNANDYIGPYSLDAYASGDPAAFGDTNTVPAGS